MQSDFVSGNLTQNVPSIRDVQLYAFCEELTGALLGFMLVFSPWAFGTSQPWSIWITNSCGLGLGTLLSIKLFIRRIKGYQPGIGYRRFEPPVHSVSALPQSFRRSIVLNPEVLDRLLAALTGAVLLYCFVAAVNGRGVFNASSGQLEYRNCLVWLPHSLDSQATWASFWRLLALACSFWAVKDWLGGAAAPEPRTLAHFPKRATDRLERMVWLLAISGTLLALEGIVQRITRTPRLLFILKPQTNPEALTQFASFAYRANAGQYFNLLWPVCLGFGWMLSRDRRRGGRRKGCLLLVCAGTMAACPLISTARGAALVDVAMLMIITATLVAWSLFDVSNSVRNSQRSVAPLILFFTGSLVLGGCLGWEQLWPRLQRAGSDLRERVGLYQQARLIARDYPVFGTGPGTFERVFQLYRPSAESYWPAQLHNDWLEIRLTFGWLGSGLIALALLTLLCRSIAASRLPFDSPLAFCLWLALSGCLIQARWDFPLQVYSILLLCTFWCGALCSSSRSSGAAAQRSAS